MPYKLTKTRRSDGKRRKNTTVVATATRLAYREMFWEPLRKRLLTHFETYGAKYEMTKATGISSAQLHCYTCPDCQHNTEPSFSLAMAIWTYLNVHDEKMRAIQVLADDKLERPDIEDELIDSMLKNLYQNPPPPPKIKVRFTRNRMIFS